MPAYLALDAALSYAQGHYRIALNVKNLADRRYYAGGVNNRALTVGDPLTILLSFSYLH